MPRSLCSLLLVLLSMFNAEAQSSFPWKLKYDSAQFFWNNNTEKSLKLLQQAERIALNDLGIYDENYLAILNDLGLVYAQLKDYKNAEKYLKQNLSIELEIYIDKDPRVQQSKCNLAIIILKSGDDLRAKIMFKNILAQPSIREYPQTYLSAIENLINLYQVNEQFDSAYIAVQDVLSCHFSDSLIQNINKFRLMESRILRKEKKYNEATEVLNQLSKSLNGISSSPSIRMA